MTSHALLFELGSRFYDRHNDLYVRAGPRITDGSLDDRPEAYVGLRRRIQGGELSLAYVSALTTGHRQCSVSRVRMLLGWGPVYSTIQVWTFTFIKNEARLKSSDFTTTVYTTYVEAAYQFNKYVTAKGSLNISVTRRAILFRFFRSVRLPRSRPRSAQRLLAATGIHVSLAMGVIVHTEPGRTR